MAAGDRSTILTLHTHSVVQASMGAGPTLTNFLGVEDVSVDPQVAEILNYAAGDYRPSFTATKEIAPMFEFSCLDIANALTLIDHQDGFGVTGATAGDEFRVYFAKKALAGTRATGSNHIRFGSKLCFVWLEEITANDNEDAIARFRVATAYDTTNECLIISTGVALPSSINPLTQKFKLGKVLLNAANLAGVTGITYRTGCEVGVVHGGGDHRPTFLSVTQVAPEIEIRVKELPAYSTFYGTGSYTVAGASACTFYLYKRLKNAVVATDITAEHIKMSTTAAFSRISMSRLSATNNQDATGAIMVRPVFDGSAKPVVFDLVSAVT